MAFKDGLSSFLTSWSGVHTAYSFNQTNANTGTDATHDANSSSYAQADTDNYPNYGLSENCSPDANGDMDAYIVTDCCMLLYIPSNLATDEYALWHNGGGTHGQMGQIRSESNGTTITLGITHNSDGTNQDYTTKVITERGWVCVGFQFEDNSGNMAIWVNGVNVQEIARSYPLKYGSGNPKIGDGNADGIPGWTAREEINGTGLLIANFVCDNPNNDNTSPAGCGDDFYTGYYNAHYDAGVEEYSGDADISGDGSQSGSVEKGGKGTGILSSAGALVLSGAIALLGSASLSSTGSQAVSVSKSGCDSGYISSCGSLDVSTKIGVFDSLSITSGGVVSISGEAGLRQSASVSIDGSVSMDGFATYYGNADIIGDGTLSVTGVKTKGKGVHNHPVMMFGANF